MFLARVWTASGCREFRAPIRQHLETYLAVIHDVALQHGRQCASHLFAERRG